MNIAKRFISELYITIITTFYTCSIINTEKKVYLNNS